MRRLRWHLVGNAHREPRLWRAMALLVVGVALATNIAHAQIRLGPPSTVSGESLGPAYTVAPTEAPPPAPLAAGAPISLEYGNQQYCAGDMPTDYQAPWTWQVLPAGLIYRSYLAGPRESRLSTVFDTRKNGQQFWDSTLGGRVGILRYGTGTSARPAGFQLDVEGAAFPRLDMAAGDNLVSADFRAGVPLTFAYGPFETKVAYYHLSSHLGDEFLLSHPGFPRINYVRNEIVWGIAYRVRPPLRLYAEAGYAFNTDGGAKPWEFQFGVDYSTLAPTGFRGAPFFAVNGYLRQDVNFGGSLVAQLGWQWRGDGPGHLFRVGAQYFNGKSVQFEFFKMSEQQLGFGVWYDY